jgi:nucleotide-binding universal stress UspA family protein
MYTDILIPCDQSEGSRRGVEHGLRLAEDYDATVHVLFVVDERIYGATPALGSDELYLEEVQTRGETALEQVAAVGEAHGLDVEVACRRGIPEEEILAYAVEREIDLVVMGGHGTVPHSRPHAKACTDRVLKTSAVPVISV